MTQSKDFKFVATLVLVFEKIKKEWSEVETRYDNFYSSLKAEDIINESHISDYLFQSIYTTIKTKLQKFLGKGLGWIIDSVIGHTINISKYNPLAK